MERTVCLYVVTLVLFIIQTANSQVNIEIYDADVFAAKTDPKVYNPNVYPKHEKPVLVNVSLSLDNFGPYDDIKSEFSMAMQVHMSWFDERLEFTPNPNSSIRSKVHHFEANEIHLLKIWRPSIYFSNPNMLNPDLLSDKSSGQIMGKIFPSGLVHIVKRTTMVGSCKVNIKLYPIDVQQCSIPLESTNSDKQLHMQWTETRPLVTSEDFTWRNFDWLDFALLNTRVNYQGVGPFSRLEAIFFLRRQMGYYLLEVYLPSALFVISSWASFWIHIPAAPARVALVLTTMLSHVTSSKAVHDKLPRVSFINSLDVWEMVCTMFIFASLIEYATANYFYHKTDRNNERKKNKNRKNRANSNSVKNQPPLPPPPPATNLEMNTERRFSESSTQTQQNRSKVGRIWHRTLQWTIPPYEHIVPRQTAFEIDRKSRFIFPISFFIFNLVYWSILLYYSYKTRDPFE